MSDQKVKIFINGVGGSQATGDYITNMIDQWVEENPTFEITGIHTSSNKYAWMVAVTYTIRKT